MTPSFAFPGTLPWPGNDQPQREHAVNGNRRYQDDHETVRCVPTGFPIKAEQ